VKSKLVYVVVAVWCVAVGAAFAAVWHYKLTPGARAAAPAQWPDASGLRRAPGVANVIMFAHPQCPCTRASMSELERLATLLGERARIHVVIAEPDDVPDDFARGAILERARALGADVMIDRGEVEAHRFGALTSGATVVYGATGALVFEGGLTVARGHEGGPAAARIRDLLARGAAAPPASPVFGCGLDRPTAEAAR
jgi:hypothetical protein